MSFRHHGMLAFPVDAVGTTVWAYTNFGAFYGALVSEDGPWSNDLISQTYASRMRSGLSIAQPVGSWNQALGYDALLRARTLTTPDGAYTYSYAGAGGLVQGLSLPGGLSITNSFDSFGQLRSTSLKDQFQNVLNYHGYDYNAAGYRTNSVRTNSYGQYVRVGYGYDSIGQLTNASGFEASGTGRLNEKFAYAYDKAGNLLSRTNGALIQTFTSDKLNQLTNITNNAKLTVAGQLSAAGSNATVNGVGAAIYGDWTFASTSGVSLSSGSNTFTISIKNSQGQTNTQVTSANLPASITPLYDSNGNLTNDGLRNFEYDAMDRLTAVTVSNAWRSEFTYDGLSRMRVRKEKTWQGAWTLTNEVRYLCLGRQVLQERDGNNAPKVTYTRGLDLSGSWSGAGGIGGLLARNDANGTAFYHADGMGNIAALVNPQGQIKARYTYDPFGNVVAKSGFMADANLYRFSSKELHPNSGMYYYGFRFYEPTLQRWMNQDPLGLAGGLNLYGFVGNDPINFFDPLGLANYPEGFIGPIQPGDFLLGGGGNYTLMLGPKGELFPTDGGITDLSMDLYDLFNVARSIPRSAKDLFQPAVCWAKKKAAETIGKPFTQKQKREMLEANRARNEGELRSDLSGEKLVPSQKSQKGVAPPPNEAQVDHMIPRSQGGQNTPENAQVLSRKENRQKSDSIP